MTRLELFAQAEARAMDLLSEAAGLDAAALTARGITERSASRIARLAAVYYDTKSMYSAYRQRCRTAGAHLSLYDLEAIEGFATKAKTLAGHTEAWKLREYLCGLPDLGTIRREGSGRITALADATGKELGPDLGARFSRHGSKTRVSLTLDQHRMAEVQALATEQARKLGGSGYTKVHLAEALHGLLTRADDAERVITRRVIYAVVPLPKLAQIQHGNGDDVTIQFSDGTSMSGREFVEAEFESEGLAALVDREEGPVDLYRLSRFASDKQRLLLHAQSTTCIWPGCRQGAENCQAHHITPWARGGPTNIKNLTNLCRYHNGLNDDDPTRPTGKGVILKRGGKICWSSPKTGNLLTLYDPAEH